MKGSCTKCTCFQIAAFGGAKFPKLFVSKNALVCKPLCLSQCWILELTLNQGSCRIHMGKDCHDQRPCLIAMGASTGALDEWKILQILIDKWKPKLFELDCNSSCTTRECKNGNEYSQLEPGECSEQSFSISENVAPRSVSMHQVCSIDALMIFNVVLERRKIKTYWIKSFMLQHTWKHLEHFGTSD